MRLLFIHDGPIFKSDNGNYYEYSYHGLYERYRYIADEIVYLMRVEPVSDNTKGTLIPDDVEVIEVPNFKRIDKYFREKKKAESIIEKEVKKADCVILRTSSCSTIAFKYLKKYSIPYIYECVGCIFDAMWNHSLIGKLLAPFSYISERKKISSSQYVLYVTNEFLQNSYPTKGKTVSCSNVVIDNVDIEVINNRIKRIKNFNDSSMIKFGTAAAIDVRYKGQQYVIKAIYRLCREGYNIHYYLAGGNRKNSQYLKELSVKLGIEDRIHFMGSLNNEQMIDFYDSLDFYIQPSLQEGLPRSLLEAMSRGLPALGTSIAGIPELIQKENLFKKKSVNCIVKSIKRILSSDIIKYSKENYYKAQQYEIDILNTRREVFYDEFISCELKKGKYEKNRL